MATLKAARVTDFHSCPLPGHVGGEILPPGSPNIHIEGFPVARATDPAVCKIGPPDRIAQGCPTVHMNGEALLAARVTDMTEHGGIIDIGASHVHIGVPGDAATVLTIKGATVGPPGDSKEGEGSGDTEDLGSTPAKPGDDEGCTGTLRVTVWDCKGSGIEFADVFALGITHQFTNFQGIAEYQAVKPGIYVVTASHSSVPGGDADATATVFCNQKTAVTLTLCAQPPCSVISIIASCEHSRSVGAGGILEVVPNTTFGRDSITLEAKVYDRCSEHPCWKIDGNLVAKAPRHSFDAKWIGLQTVAQLVTLWIPDAQPKRYRIACGACNGENQELEVHAYPPNEISVNVEDYKDAYEKIQKIMKRIEVVADVIADGFRWKYPKVGGSVKAAWKEHTDHRVYYSYKIDIKAQPLIGVATQYTLGPGKVTKLAGKIPGVGKYLKQVIEWFLKAGLVVKFDGDITIEFSYTRDSPDKPLYVGAAGSGVTGRITVGLGFEGRIVGDLTQVDIEGSGAIEASGSPFLNRRGVGASLSVDFGGITGPVKIVFLWGIVDVDETVIFVGPEKIYGPADVYFVEF